MPKKPNEQKIVSWFVVNKSLIKFDGEEESISVSNTVMDVSDFEKYPIGKGDTVEVGTKNDEVSFLRKIKTDKPAKSGKKEEKSVDITGGNTEIKDDITIFAVAGNKKVVKFEKDGAWIKVSSAVQKQSFDDIGLVAGNLVSVTLVNGDIASITKKACAKIVNPIVNKGSNKSSYKNEDGMDRRTAIMCAKDVTVSLVATGMIDKVKIETAIKDLSKTFHDALKEL